MPIGRVTGQSDFNSAEISLSTMRVGNDLIKLQLPPTLTKRTLWGLHVAVNTATDWYMAATLKLSLAGGIVGEFPFDAGNSTAIPSSLPRSMTSILVPNSGSSPVARSIFVAVQQPLAVAGPFAGESAFYYLSPFDLEIEADLLTLSINSFVAVSALHAYIAVQSVAPLQ